MSDSLVSFSGTYGDIAWSMPTVRAISEMIGKKVDFACMPQYESLLPLLQLQPYIDKAFVIKNWIREHSNWGDQPWMPPPNAGAGYERQWHLGYRVHPNMPIIDFTAHQQGIKLKDPLPFLTVPDVTKGRHIAYAFNYQYSIEKTAFFRELQQKLPAEYVDVTKLPWVEAAMTIKAAVGMVCCRSSNYVLAHGVGQQDVFVYEPHHWRNMNPAFCCPYSREVVAPITVGPEKAAEIAASFLGKWLAEAA